jgi:hypothetical protein
VIESSLEELSKEVPHDLLEKLASEVGVELKLQLNIES